MLHPRVHTPAGKSRFAPPPPPPPPSRPPIPPSNPSFCGNKVRVVARIRPFLPAEIAGLFPDKKPVACIAVCKGHGSEEDTLHIQDPMSSREGSFKVDSCYGEGEEISAIFAKEVEPLLPALFQGYNATVFAYGATGSGKTYTMQGLEDHPGLMPLALTSILAMSEHYNSRVEVSYYEVYMDRCYDLLGPGAAEISVLEGSDGRVQLRGLSQVHVKSLAEFREVFLNGCLRRKVGQTGLNDASSRSHGVLMVTVTKDDNISGFQTIGKLNLIDLAGNEDNRKTGNEGVRLAESARINQSLFALSNVINALNSNESRVPYRDSKLTRILQDSLGGTSGAIMIACLNPRSYQEAAHTLSLAARSRQIMNLNVEKKSGPDIKVDMEAKLQAWLAAKGRTSSVKPSPWKVKPLFYTPSRQHINHIRRLERNASKESSTSLKPRRIHVPSQPDSFAQEAKGREQTVLRSSLPSTNSRDTGQTLTERNDALRDDQSSMEQCSSTDINSLEISGIYSEEESSHIGTVIEREKENFPLDLPPFTPHPNIMKKSSSPPLSERLNNLRSAMKDILQPRSVNMPNEESLKPTSNEYWSPKFKQLNLSPFASPDKSVSVAAFKIEQSTGTPLEKFNKNGSGIKNTMVKEYLSFLNTASREELLELKGIGDRRAAYILELRNMSPEPFKELEDLERIGISKKQALSLFTDTARQIFFTD